MKRTRFWLAMAVLTLIVAPAMGQTTSIGTWQTNDNGDDMTQRVEDDWNSGDFVCKSDLAFATEGILNICRTSCAPTPLQCPGSCPPEDKAQLTLRVPDNMLLADYDFSFTVQDSVDGIECLLGSAPANTIGAPAVDVLLGVEGEQKHCRALRCRGDAATNGQLCDAQTNCGMGACSGICLGGPNAGLDCAAQGACPGGACIPPFRTCVGGPNPGKNCVTNLDCPPPGVCAPNPHECTAESTHDDLPDGDPIGLPMLGTWTVPFVVTMLLVGVWFLRRRFAPGA